MALPAGTHKLDVAIAGAAAPFRLTLSADGQEQASAPLPKIVTVRGEAYVGRPRIDGAGPLECGCTIRSVEVKN